MVQVLPSTAFLPRLWGFPSSSWACPLARWWPNTWQLGGFLGLGSWQSKVKVASFYLCFCPSSLHWIFGGGVGGRFFSFELPERLQVIDTSTHKAFRTSKGALPRCVPKRRMTWTLVALDVFFGHERKIFSHKFHDQSTTDKNPPVIRCLPNLVVYGSTPIRFPWVFLLNKAWFRFTCGSFFTFPYHFEISSFRDEFPKGSSTPEADQTFSACSSTCQFVFDGFWLKNGPNKETNKTIIYIYIDGAGKINSQQWNGEAICHSCPDWIEWGTVSSKGGNCLLDFSRIG